jgi:molybdopterin-guanine dinucleotide biosynthesis protein B
MKLIHNVGRKNHGKTTLIVELIKELSRRGLCVGVIKHSSHAHELDTPGKDSHSQRLAGASPVAVVTTDLVGVYMQRDAQADFYEQLSPMYTCCDLVLVEGHIDADGMKIEVWRQATDQPPLAASREDITAVVTDDQIEVAVPVWRRDDVRRLADEITRLLSLG